MKLAIALVILVALSLVFHFISPWWLTPIASNWGSIDDTIEITFWITGAVFVAVNLFLAYVVFRYRFQKNRRAHYEPENKKLEVWLTVITATGVCLMLAPGLVVWAKFVNPPTDAAELEVVAQQWQWGFRFPGEDQTLGKSDVRFISVTNPLGIDPKDPFAQDDIIIDNNELHLPINQAVKVWIRSKDVLHNFAVPQFRVKMDAVPGLVSSLWFTPEKIGRFDILCMELCGIAHHTMRGFVVVDSETDFQQWLSQQPTFASTQGGPVGDAVAGESLYALCSSCHGPRGEGNQALNAPRISGQSPHYLKRQLVYYKAGIRGRHPEDTYGQQMAAMAETLPDETAINDVVAYIQTLSSSTPAATLTGHRDKGQPLFVSCAACHGAQGQGRFSTSAPRLAGLQDWYLKRQLVNYQTGLRGAHAADNFGKQMTLMANMLSDEESMNNLLAYIQSL
ncbi:cytochrome c oxidase subunit II [Aestuariicella hydrocarbonica]|uniref:cytochrome-c oxidase n=1 Tax=Pseudomaricurvus hydrocarbonicus TaxID=1470433 RepID=A0A9E5MMM4_9GAMM|nr:cytochrome c oxidase subunit II [Aestuariicella hydrocarbonica]NHO67026.1 cytochrome c oxidase subunit II [Aestuariicella hydrocarbonica]